MKRFLSLSFALGALAVAPAALADGPITSETTTAAGQVDTIYLRDGGLYRGRASEIVPGDHVTVQLPNGETKILPWSEVDRVIVASTPIPPPPTEQKPVANAPIVGPTARVHLTSSGKTFLYRRAQGTSDFVTACESPCDVDLPLGDTYKVGGSGISTTKEFRIDGQPGGNVNIDVDGPNWFGIVGGGLLTISGGVVAYVGVILALAGGAAGGSCTYDCSDTKDVRNVGLGLLAIGAVGIAGGLLIVFPSLKTDVTQDSAAPKSARRDQYLRTPTWRSAGIESSAPSAMFPVLFSHSF